MEGGGYLPMHTGFSFRTLAFDIWLPSPKVLNCPAAPLYTTFSFSSSMFDTKESAFPPMHCLVQGLGSTDQRLSSKRLTSIKKTQSCIFSSAHYHASSHITSSLLWPLKYRARLWGTVLPGITLPRSGPPLLSTTVGC